MPFKLTLNDSGAFASLRSEAEKAQENCENSFFFCGGRVRMQSQTKTQIRLLTNFRRVCME